MSSVNKVILIGRLGKDPELKSTPSGAQVCKFSVATDETWKDKSGQQQKKTEWHNIVAWNKLAEICGQYLTKGKQVYVEGKLETKDWESKSGEKHYSTQVVARDIKFLGSRENGNGHADDSQHQYSDPSASSDEEIPF